MAIRIIELTSGEVTPNDFLRADPVGETANGVRAIEFKSGTNNRRGDWRPFVEARAFVRTLKLKSKREWAAWRQSGEKPADIPAYPSETYADAGWVSWGDWLGTNSRHSVDWRPFDRARAFARALKLRRTTEWAAWHKANKPADIPANPSRTYGDSGWVSWGDWLGTDNHRGDWRPFAEARAFVHALELNSQGEWRAYCASGQKPNNIPSNASTVYANEGWAGYSDWLGNSRRRGGSGA